MPGTPLRVTLLTLTLLSAVPARAGEDGPDLPRRFRDWTHVRSMVVTDGEHGMYGFHDVYANPAALAVLRGAGPRRYPDGAIFVVSIYEVVTKDGMTVAGPKRRDVLQVKDGRAAATGGWRFAAFDPAGKRIAIDGATCYGCHASARETDAVFAAFTR